MAVPVQAPIHSGIGPRRVVYILEELNFGGTQRQTLELATRLDPDRYSPVFWTLSGGTPDFLDAARDRGIPVEPLTPLPAFRPWPALSALWSRINQDRPGLVHLCTALPNIWGRIFGSLHRLPGIVASCRSGSAVRDQHERVLRRLAHAHVCNSKPLHDILVKRLGLPAARVAYIPNGVNTEFFTPAPKLPEAPEILCVARLVPVKNHGNLLDAFARVLHVLPAARLHLVGNGPLRDRLQRVSSEPRFAGRVVMHPGTTNLLPLLRLARVFALCSDNEGMPNAVLEAMSCGLPVVATQVGALPDLVENGHSGLLVPAADPARLAEALLRLLQDYSLCVRMGRQGRARAERNHANGIMAERHMRLYDQILEART